MTKKKSKLHFNNKNSLPKGFWLFIGIVLIALLLWVKLSLNSTELSYKIQKIEKEIEQEQIKKTDFEKELNQKLSLTAIEKDARKNGWTLPKSSSVIVVPL